MTTEDNKADVMAEHFVNGLPEVRGRWDESAKAAGYSRIPSTKSENVLAAVDRARERVSTTQLKMLDTVLENKSADWSTLAQQLRPLQVQIATGKTHATATQMKAISEIMLRGYGRPVERQQESALAAVVVLPMLGSDGTATVCPNCQHELEEQGEVAEHIAAMRMDVGQSGVKT